LGVEDDLGTRFVDMVSPGLLVHLDHNYPTGDRVVLFGANLSKVEEAEIAEGFGGSLGDSEVGDRYSRELRCVFQHCFLDRFREFVY
jgi:hypothetical protein